MSNTHHGSFIHNVKIGQIGEKTCRSKMSIKTHNTNQLITIQQVNQ